MAKCIASYVQCSLGRIREVCGCFDTNVGQFKTHLKSIWYKLKSIQYKLKLFRSKRKLEKISQWDSFLGLPITYDGYRSKEFHHRRKKKRLSGGLWIFSTSWICMRGNVRALFLYFIPKHWFFIVGSPFHSVALQTRQSLAQYSHPQTLLTSNPSLPLELLLSLQNRKDINFKWTLDYTMLSKEAIQHNL